MPDFVLEAAARQAGYLIIAGVDEAGRGPWAGPVVAGAAILKDNNLSEHLRTGLDDSKKLKPAKRKLLFDLLQAEALTGVGIASVEEIDQLNILQATFLAMNRAVENLARAPDYLLVDGNRPPKSPYPLECIIKGDGKSLSIAAASIIAKVSRDRIMKKLAQKFPGYGWERNAGYGTAEHKQAMERLGVCAAHRKSYAPVIKMLSLKDS